MSRLKDTISVIVFDRNDKRHEIIAPTDIDMNLMEVCKASDLDVEGTCGGMALCASCHCYVLSDHDLKLPNSNEEDMLDQAFFVESNSRLSCQLKIEEHLNGLTIKLAPV